MDGGVPLGDVPVGEQHHRRKPWWHSDRCDPCGNCDMSGCDAPSCDLPGCDGCDVCDCNLSVFRLFRLSSLMLAVATVSPRRARPAAAAGVAAIRGYQRWISPRLAVRCRYTPSCSAYGATAVTRHGLRDGLRLTASRLRRCGHQVPPGTPDPVP